jgi:hypothetical protein
MTYSDSRYKIFQLKGLPPGLFGETYAVAVGIHTSGQYFKGEYFVMTQLPNPALHKVTFRYSSTDVPEDLLTVDVDFMVEEAGNQAEIHLIDRLSERATELQRLELLSLHVQLIECAVRPFVGCWLRGQFHNQLREIASSTECTSLAAYINMVSQLPPFQRQ